mmetsp:Transcript_22906/g.50085  ORF Transcript_22906/g.50085 Transcript_22906/m.50085 type:complete len:260 (-) Transcript_22906:252-1031(-)
MAQSICTSDEVDAWRRRLVAERKLQAGIPLPPSKPPVMGSKHQRAPWMDCHDAGTPILPGSSSDTFHLLQLKKTSSLGRACFMTDPKRRFGASSPRLLLGSLTIVEQPSRNLDELSRHHGRRDSSMAKQEFSTAVGARTSSVSSPFLHNLHGHGATCKAGRLHYPERGSLAGHAHAPCSDEVPEKVLRLQSELCDSGQRIQEIQHELGRLRQKLEKKREAKTMRRAVAPPVGGKMDMRLADNEHRIVVHTNTMPSFWIL